VRPTEYLEQWSERDRKLAESTILKDRALYCQCGCGQLKRLAHDPDTEGWWKVGEVRCEARVAMEQDIEDDKKPEPGVLKYVYLDPAYKPSAHAGEPVDEATRAERLAALSRELGIQP
jgi:hypothetical protein